MISLSNSIKASLYFVIALNILIAIVCIYLFTSMPSSESNAWLVVLLAVFAFVCELAVMRQITRRLIIPLTVIQKILAARLAGDKSIRCPEKGRDLNIQRIYNALNALMDSTL